MADRGKQGRDLLSEWRRVLEGAVASAGRVAGRGELPQDLLGAMRRQLELAEALLERERHIAARLVAPIDTLFDLFEETAVILRRQSEALEAAGRALEETAGLAKRQAEMFERSIGTLRQPAEIAKAVAGLERRSPRRQPPRTAARKPEGGAGGKRASTPPAKDAPPAKAVPRAKGGPRTKAAPQTKGATRSAKSAPGRRRG